MELTRKQEQALAIALHKYRNHEPYTVVAGYAGTGKSTLVRFIIAALDLLPHDVTYVAYTGKAAQVLRSKGCANATTAHRLLYKSIRQADGSFKHFPKRELDQTYKLIVVDEVSMLPKKMWDLLLSHGVHVIACGDPGQLPPVDKDQDNHVLEHPDIFLDEIMRQAADNDIIRLSMDVREGRAISAFKGKDANVVRRHELCDGMLQWADQVICGKNATRRSLNNHFRELVWGKDVETAPLIGDKIICLKNDWDHVTEVGDALVNGMTGELTKIATRPDDFLGKMCFMDFMPEGADDNDLLDCAFHSLITDWKLITTGVPTITKENYRTLPWFIKKMKLQQFDYGYAITCWKAQGSEFGKVTFLAENVGFMSREEYAKYLYTGITRASEKLTLILPT